MLALEWLDERNDGLEGDEEIYLIEPVEFKLFRGLKPNEDVEAYDRG